MKKIFKNTGITLFLALFNLSDIFPQSGSINLSSGELMEMRPGDILRKNIELEYYSMTRFMQN